LGETRQIYYLIPMAKGVSGKSGLQVITFKGNEEAMRRQAAKVERIIKSLSLK